MVCDASVGAVRPVLFADTTAAIPLGAVAHPLFSNTRLASKHICACNQTEQKINNKVKRKQGRQANNSQ